jgi:hypothetical protein
VRDSSPAPHRAPADDDAQPARDAALAAVRPQDAPLVLEQPREDLVLHLEDAIGRGEATALRERAADDELEERAVAPQQLRPRGVLAIGASLDEGELVRVGHGRADHIHEARAAGADPAAAASGEKSDGWTMRRRRLGSTRRRKLFVMWSLRRPSPDQDARSSRRRDF